MSYVLNKCKIVDKNRSILYNINITALGKGHIVRKKLFWTIGIVLVVIVTLIAVMHAAGPKIIISKTSISERRALEVKVIKAVQMVADKSQDPQAAELATYMKSSVVLAEAISYDGKMASRIVESSKSSDWFMLLPLTKDDGNLKGWSDFAGKVQETEFGGYEWHTNTMTIRFDQPISDTWLGIYGLHETKHAFDFHAHPYQRETDQEYCYREVQAHEFQNSIQSKVFGKQYDGWVNVRADKMSTDLKNRGVLGKQYDGPASLGPLPAFFGKPVSGFDKDLIYTATWIDVCFHIVDTHFHASKEAREDRKARFLYPLYLRSGILKGNG